jgi:hypothetical protein
MDLITIIVVLIVVGLLVWVVDRYLPVAQPFKGLVIVLIVLLLVIWLLSGIGVLPHWRVRG